MLTGLYLWETLHFGFGHLVTGTTLSPRFQWILHLRNIWSRPCVALTWGPETGSFHCAVLLQNKKYKYLVIMLNINQNMFIAFLFATSSNGFTATTKHFSVYAWHLNNYNICCMRSRYIHLAGDKLSVKPKYIVVYWNIFSKNVNGHHKNSKYYHRLIRIAVNDSRLRYGINYCFSDSWVSGM